MEASIAWFSGNKRRVWEVATEPVLVGGALARIK
jgi:hypothetical protein